MTTLNSRGWHELVLTSPIAPDGTPPLTVSFPATSRITDQKTREATERLLEAYGDLKVIERGQAALRAEESSLENEARSGADVRKKLRSVREQLEEVEIGRRSAQGNAWAIYLQCFATWEANREALEAGAIEEIQAALGTIAGGAKMLRDANARIDAGFGTLWMFSEVGDASFRLYPRQKLYLAGGDSPAAKVSIALAAAESALGTVKNEIDGVTGA